MILLDLNGEGLLLILAYLLISLGLMTVVPIILIIIGFVNKKANRHDRAKKFFIAAVICFIVGAGICGIPSLVWS